MEWIGLMCHGNVWIREAVILNKLLEFPLSSFRNLLSVNLKTKIFS